MITVYEHYIYTAKNSLETIFNQFDLFPFQFKYFCL